MGRLQLFRHCGYWLTDPIVIRDPRTRSEIRSSEDLDLDG